MMKALVYGSIFITTVQSGIEWYFTYYQIAWGWGYSAFYTAQTSIAYSLTQNLQATLDGLTALFVQCFFTWRIWTFCMAVCGKKIKLFVAAICLFIVLASVCGFIGAVMVPLLLLPRFDAHVSPLAVILLWSVPSALADVTITVSMMVILLNAKARTDISETRDRISQLLRITVQTGFLTSVMAVPAAPLFVFTNDTEYYSLTWYALGKFYVISLLANLNARTYRPNADPRAVRGKGNVLDTSLPTPSDPNHSGSSGVLSPIRSAVHAIHRDLTSPPKDLDLCVDQENHRAFNEGGSPEAVHAQNDGREEVLSTSLQRGSRVSSHFEADRV